MDGVVFVVFVLFESDLMVKIWVLLVYLVDLKVVGVMGNVMVYFIVDEKGVVSVVCVVKLLDVCFEVVVVELVK